nr:PREDICTED: transmembrane and coiled-coil domains protein 1 [Latimeria chalumnae]|eukprot:XP_005997890.1 PREDICTED: transmembrane and coiled-coil domains protein 1 [Latimeria chalumnae]
MEHSDNGQAFDDPDPEGKPQDQEGKKTNEPEQRLSKITHNALENIGVIGQGLKQLFHPQRRRSSVCPYDVQQAQADAELPAAAADPEGQGSGSETDGVSQTSAHPTALNRVLQQIRVAPMMKRGTSLHSKRSKPEPPPKGSPQIHRRSTQDGMVSLLQPLRPRSSSATEAPTSVTAADTMGGSHLLWDEPDRIERLEVSSLAQSSSAVASSADGSINVDSVDGTPDPQRTKVVITHLQQKILKLTEQIKIEQTARDNNVAEYLELANNADKQQSTRIKQVRPQRTAAGNTCERLEEQLNDLTELHQNEILNLKQELASMEEKIAYQSYERARDIQEALEACQTRISKMELQQQQQQVVQLEGLENATARTLLGKLINVLLAIMAVVLVFVSTVANCVVPLMKTRNRTFSTFFLVVVIAFLWKNWEAITNYLERFMLPPR